HGSAWSRSLEMPMFQVTEARFAPGAVLPAHTHPRPICAIMLAGSFDTRIGSRTLSCRPATVWTEPCEEKHRNDTGTAGAHVLVMQPDPHRADIMQPLQRFLDGVHAIERSGMVAEARRVLSEMRDPDALAALSIEALLLGMITQAARVTRARERNGVPPAWLRVARDFIHAEFRRGPRLDAVARAAGVRPGELTVAFRRHYGRSIGAYARDLRLEWALEQLRQTDRPIAGIAVAAGYSDQSHFTRECTARVGVSPARVRRRLAP
ncbi:MAG TPA: AraC family transcriptional regulator, partial [Longimicrobiales bacterium]|nr:AraC family transcriptional regulator [Longimicrobiales bacterium]